MAFGEAASRKHGLFGDRWIRSVRRERRRRALFPAEANGRRGIAFSIGLVLAGLGPTLIVLSASPSVAAIRVSKKEGLIDFSNLFGNPSLYVVVRTLEGPQRLDTKNSTPVGGGLVWYLPQPVPVSETIRVEVWHSGLLHDRLEDQVETRNRLNVGQRFQFELIFQRSLTHIAGICSLMSSSVCICILILYWLFHQHLWRHLLGEQARTGKVRLGGAETNVHQNVHQNG